jgi:hypothetical protein
MKPDKSIIKELKAIAAQLPPAYTAEGQKTVHIISGEKLMLAGKERTSNGETVDPSKIYNLNVDGGVQVNHFKRMLKMWVEGRKEAIQQYIKDVFELSRAHNNVVIGLQQRASSLI